MFKRLFTILILVCFIVTPKGADLGVLFNSTNNNTVSPDNLVIATFYISTNLQLKYITPSRALSIDASSNVVASTLTSTQQGYLAALTGGTNLINLGLAKLTSGAGNPTNGIMATNRTLYINTSSATINDSLWVNLDTNWFRIASTNGGSINETQLNFSDVTTANSSTNFHGLLKKLSGNTTQFMRGDGNWALPSNNLSNSLAGVRYIGVFDPDPSQQGYTFYNTNLFYTTGSGGTLGVPNILLPNSGEIIGDATTDILIGSGAVFGTWNVSNYTDTTIGNVTTSAHGLAPKGDGNSAHFLNGIGGYSTPAGGVAGTITSTGSPNTDFVTYWSGATTITGTANFSFNHVTQTLTAPGIVSSTLTTDNLTIPANSVSGNVTYGTYTPTVTAGVNCTTASTTQTLCTWSRIGNVINVDGKVQIIKLNSNIVYFYVSLPVATTFSLLYQVNGTCVSSSTISPYTPAAYGVVGAYITGNSSQFTLSSDSFGGTLRDVKFHFTYTIQ